MFINHANFEQYKITIHKQIWDSLDMGDQYTIRPHAIKSDCVVIEFASGDIAEAQKCYNNLRAKTSRVFRNWL